MLAHADARCESAGAYLGAEGGVTGGEPGVQDRALRIGAAAILQVCDDKTSGKINTF